MEPKNSKKSMSGKQAVVVIHGMGEQRPMETLRQFVDTVWNGDDELNNKEPSKKTWVTPDVGVGNTELMRITTDFHECHLCKDDDENAKARTDFFEFYWADIFANSQLSMLTPWVRALLFRLPNNVPHSVFTLWITMWTILLLMVIGFGQAVYAAYYKTDSTQLEYTNFVLYAGRSIVDFIALRQTYTIIIAALVIYIVVKLLAGLLKGFREKRILPHVAIAIKQAVIVLIIVMFFLATAKYLSQLANEVSTSDRGLWQILPLNIILSLIILFLLNSFIIPYFGDVARYLHTSPNTVGDREKIRQRGLTLLRRLHNDDQYDRIIIVAHSLGTVIAYDLIRILWAEYGPVNASNSLSKEQTARFQNVANIAGKAGIKNTWSKEQLLEYRAAQKDAFYALQTNNHNSTSEETEKIKRWKISDFVTFGSPLTHSRFLVAKSKAHLEGLIGERTLPTCPPVFEQGDNRYSDDDSSNTYLYQTGKTGIESTRAHHATPFAVVRWSNVFDWRVLGFFGDFVSGPLKQLFGAGIADYHVRFYHGAANQFARYITHALYWKSDNVVSHPAGERATTTKNNIPYHVALLRSAVDMRFSSDQLQNFNSGTNVTHPVAKYLQWIVWALLILAGFVLFYLVWSYLWIWTSTFMNF